MTANADMADAMDRKEDEETSSERASDNESDNGDNRSRGGASGSDSDGFQPEDGSDTARIAQSVTKYARLAR